MVRAVRWTIGPAASTPGMARSAAAARATSAPGGSAIVAAPCASMPLKIMPLRRLAAPSRYFAPVVGLNRTPMMPGTTSAPGMGSRATERIPIRATEDEEVTMQAWLVGVGVGVGGGGMLEPPPPPPQPTIDRYAAAPKTAARPTPRAASDRMGTNPP